MRAFTLVVVSVLAACRVTGTFECGLDQACRRGDELGMCEEDGYCSFGDSACTSGRRYGDNAGDGLANMCVADTAAPLTCRDRWRMNVIHFGAVTDLGVSSAMDDRDPWLGAGGTTLVFSSTRTGSASSDIYLTTRATIFIAFAPPTLVAALNSTSTETHVSFSADGLTVYLNSSRAGTKGGMDVWRATRTTPTGTFAAPDQMMLESVNTADDENDVLLSANGLSLYLARKVANVPQQLAVATRATTADPFGPATPIVELAAGSDDADPVVTSDELLVVFTSSRPAPQTGSNLWYSVRATTTDAWSPPRLVPDINSDGDDGDAFLTDDACTLVFARRPSPTATYDVVYVGVTP